MEDPEQQGMVMGLNNAFNNAGRAAAPVWAGFVFDVHISLPYLTGAAIMAAGFLIALRRLRAAGGSAPNSLPRGDTGGRGDGTGRPVITP